MNQIWIVSSICIDGATLKISGVCLVVRKKLGSQTDRHGDNISVFFPNEKSAKKSYNIYNKDNKGR